MKVSTLSLFPAVSPTQGKPGVPSSSTVPAATTPRPVDTFEVRPAVTPDPSWLGGPTTRPSPEICPDPTGLFGPAAKPTPEVCPDPNGFFGPTAKPTPEVCPDPTGLFGPTTGPGSITG